ncbi:MAG: hypothetical protein ACRDUX_21360 [Mycobacterium sp.]
MFHADGDFKQSRATARPRHHLIRSPSKLPARRRRARDYPERFPSRTVRKSAADRKSPTIKQQAEFTSA